MSSLTNIAAWWGAIIATFVLLWDIYKWFHSGPIIRLIVSPNMQVIGDFPPYETDKNYISVEVSNIGDRKTTITHLVGFHYNSLFSKLLNRKSKTFFVPQPALSPLPIPHIINPGERWVGGIEQNIDLTKMSQKGYLYCGIYHSSSKKPVMQRIIIHKNNKKLNHTNGKK